jgi:hypothetical protein
MVTTHMLRATVKAIIPKHLHPIMFDLRRQWRRSARQQQLLGSYATAVLTETDHGKLLVPAGDIEVGYQLVDRV